MRRQEVKEPMRMLGRLVARRASIHRFRHMRCRWLRAGESDGSDWIALLDVDRLPGAIQKAGAVIIVAADPDFTRIRTAQESRTRCGASLSARACRQREGLWALGC